MIRYFKSPIVALSTIFIFLGILASQDPLNQTLENGIQHKNSLAQLAAGCQTMEPWNLPDSNAQRKTLDLPRINPSNSQESFTGIADLIHDGNIVILYDSTVEDMYFDNLRAEAITALSENSVPLYLIPSLEADWETRGNYAMYGKHYTQECVEPDSRAFTDFWETTSPER